MEVTTMEPPARMTINSNGKGRPVKKSASSGPVERGVVYTLDDFLARTRWSRHALKTAKRNGLRTTIEGNIAFVSGDAFCDWIESRQAAK